MASSSRTAPAPPDPAIPMIPSQHSDIEITKMLRALVDPMASPPGDNSLIIHATDVFVQDPADLTQQFAPVVAEDGQNAWYFSTKLEPKNQRGKRKRRCMESGVWHDEGKSKPVVGSQARRYLFSFLNKAGNRTGWIMHEFRFPVPDGNEEESPVVLCKVFRSSRRCAPNPAISAAMAEAQAQAEVGVVEEEEALVKALEEREAAVEAREAELAAWQAREVEGEASARRAARFQRMSQHFRTISMVLFMDIVANMLELPAREAEMKEALHMLLAMASLLRELREVPTVPLVELQARFAAMYPAREGRALVWEPSFALMWDTALREEFERRLAESARAAELGRLAEVREAEVEALARRDAARLALLERHPQEQERDLEPWEQTRLQAIYDELEAEVEALVLMMAAILTAAALVSRAGQLMLLPIAGGSRAAAVAHCGGALENGSEGLELPRSCNVDSLKGLCLKFCIKENSVEI